MTEKESEIENTNPDLARSESQIQPNNINADAVSTSEEPQNSGTGDSLTGRKGLKNKFNRLGIWCKGHKISTGIIVLLLVIAVILGVPTSRYAVLSIFKKQSVSVVVHDSQTGAPVTEAEVLLGNKKVKTNKEGKAVFPGTKLGKTSLHITKTYYKSTDLTFTVGLAKLAPINTKLIATGRQVPITITNQITGETVPNALVQSLGSKARSDKNGNLVLVLPADKQTVSASITLTGYNDKNVTVRITTSESPDNKFNITPSGKVYFLSKLSGSIDVVKTNLDGSERKVVLAGTGQEDDRGTVLLASKDWKYLALQSKRDSAQPKLYLINTSTDQLKVIDEGATTFTITGWLNHDFIYKVDKANTDAWQTNSHALKGFNADTGRVTVLDQTNAEGTGINDYANESYGPVYALNGVILFSKGWSASYAAASRLSGKQATIISIKADGTGKNTLKTLSLPTSSTNFNVSFDSRAYDAGGVFFNDNIDSNFYKYEDGQINTTSEVTADNFYTKVYSTFLQSPDSKQNFWSESRDGKNTLFVGDANGKNGQQVATLSDYTQYGWFTDNYLLVSKNSSELYIMSVDGKHAAIKISDYHKPQFNYVGYGGGYGGI